MGLELNYDGLLDIATGLSANAKKWVNQKMRWAELVDKLITANPTNETLQEYLTAPKPSRDRIKDVGGYIGGYVRGGRRTPKTNILHRQVITLDIDYGDSDFWDLFTLQFSNAAVLHATHSHTEDSPRYRLIMPIDREVTADEYIAIARRIAGNLDIEVFDNTTFQIQRLMYWPSSPKDVDYFYEMQDGPFVSADGILSTYHDWTDSIEWPISAKHKMDIANLKDKQEDPHSKKGVVGAFCRAYGIQEAIETFLSDKYVACDMENRYTYTNGSTSAGLVVYDDKFAYSHHGTDPSSGKLCNSFDLVRLHLYGHLDDNAKSKTSYTKMSDMAREDKAVRESLFEEKITNAQYAFNDHYEEEIKESEDAEEDDNFGAELQIDGRGKYLSTARNINILLDRDKKIGIFELNKFDNKRYLTKSPPWRKLKKKPEAMGNVDYSGIRNYLEATYQIVGTQKIEDALALTFEKNSYHPIKDYLNGLEWDGVCRLDELLIKYFGSDDNLYTREAIRKTLVGAVARVFNPGCKFDLVLTLVGDQGNGKSTFVNKIGRGWSSDTFMTVHGKDAFEQLQGVWLVEIAELSGLRKAEVEAIKHFISKQEDNFRPAYARTSEVFKRQCVFIGTTNSKTFLRDPSGNRRFMPVDTLPKELLKNKIQDIADEEINQIWAEAMEYYRQDEPLFLSPEAEALAKVEQHQHSMIDERTGIIENYLNTLLLDDWDKIDTEGRRMFLGDESEQGTKERHYVCIPEIWCECLGKSRDSMDRYKTREINELMRGLPEWEYIKSTKNFPIYGKQKYYRRIKNDLL